MAKVKKHPHAGQVGAARDFIKIVHDLTHYRNHAEVFADFLELSFCSVAKTMALTTERADALEARYMDVVARNAKSPNYIREMPKLLGIATLALNGGSGGDFLGHVAGELGALNAHVGQFFTPFEVSKTMAMLILSDVKGIIDAKGYVSISEPASGAGGMILAAADVIEGQGFDIGQTMFVQATDISFTAYKMTYLQLALRGIPAEVFHGNALSLEVWDSSLTPALVQFHEIHGEALTAWRRGATARAARLSAPVVQTPQKAKTVAALPKQPNAKKPPVCQPAVAQLGFDL